MSGLQDDPVVPFTDRFQVLTIEYAYMLTTLLVYVCPEAMCTAAGRLESDSYCWLGQD